MDAISNARISVALSRDLVSAAPLSPRRTGGERSGVEAGRVEAIRRRARREREAYRERLQRENELNREFSKAFRKLNDKPVVIPRTLRQADREMRPLDRQGEDEQAELSARLEAARRQLEEAGALARDPSVSWEYRRRLLMRSRSLISEHLSSLKGLLDRYYQKYREFTHKNATWAQLQVGERIHRLQMRREFLEKYYDLLESIAGRGGKHTNELSSLARQGDAVDPSLARHPQELARQEHRGTA